MDRIACIALVDVRGWVLLQERDEHAPKQPDKWGMVGGHVDDGEDFESAAYRELEEETGVRLAPGDLMLWREGEFDSSYEEEPFSYRVYLARTRLTDADILVGEGRQIVFVDPAEIPALDRTESSAYLLDQLLASPEYAALTEG